MNFIPGQRWASDAEPELGLGTLLRCDERAVQVLFAKSGVVRNYAAHGAPLTRATFRVGQRIAGRGISFVVERIDLRDGLLVYSGERRELVEGQLDDEQSLSQADARLISARVDRAHRYELRKHALVARAQARQSDAWGILSARIDLLPHQLGVVAACMERAHPRALLADEAGLGKTIEAGMLIARMLATGRATRVLIVVPDPLVVQWFVEMHRRFQLQFAIVDEERCASISAADPEQNPFDAEQLALVAQDWLAATPVRAEQCRSAGWDMLIVDEAHHLEWTPEAASPGYAAVDALAQAVPSVILLTATPEQLGRRGHYARLRLLDPQRFSSLDQYLAEAAGYAEWTPIAARIAAHEPLDDDARAGLLQRFGNDPALGKLIAGYPQQADALLSALIDRHGTGRVMYRNRRESVGGFPGRELAVPAHDVALDVAAREALVREFHRDTGSEAPIDTVPDYARDPRVVWLTDLLDSNPDAKFLLIATTQVKVEAIAAALRASCSVSFTSFHEGMTLLQRDRAAAWFAQAGGARLLLCSELGSEGRNFQFAHHLVLWDLPIDPDLVEQRIGRLDRIGQHQAISLHCAPLPGTAQEAITRWHADGTRVLRECPADGRELLRQFGHDILQVAVSHAIAGESDDPELDNVVAATAAAHAQLSQEIASGRDRLLELASRHAGAATLHAAIAAADADVDTQTLIQECFEPFGVTAEDADDGSFVLDPEFLSTDALPGFAAGPRHVTFDRALALAREDLDLLRLDHPLVVGALDLLLAGEDGNAALLVDPALPPRSVLLEAIYLVECVANVGLNVARFLPPFPVCACVDSRLVPRDYTPSPRALAHARAHVLDLTRQRRHLAQLVPPMLEQTELVATEKMLTVTSTATTRAREVLGARIQRLSALAAIHGSVPDAEIAAAKSHRDAVLAALASARLRLDAVRMAVSADFFTLR